MTKLIESKSEFQELAAVRLAESKALLDAGLSDGAYYLAGYAVELALKACIIKLLMARDAFPRREFSVDCYTHNLELLLELAGLGPAREAAAQSDAKLLDNWLLVRAWSEAKRYHRIDQAKASDVYDAIADPQHRVLQWIKSHW